VTSTWSPREPGRVGAEYKLLPPRPVLWQWSYILHIELWFKEGFGTWCGKFLAPSATKQQSTSESREGVCSHLTSPFSFSDLSNLSGLVTPAVSLGTAEGCCGSEMLFRNTLIAWHCLASECSRNSQARKE